jgi:flagellin-like protein
MNGRNLKKGSFKKEEDAVSPVIGVILMVAITVILAAVIGAFVFGMGGSVSKTYTIGVTAAQTGADKIDLTFQGGPDADVVDYIEVSVNNVKFGRASNTTSLACEGPSYLTPALGDIGDGGTVAVGTAVTLDDTVGTSDAITADRDHLIVTATFVDGSKQVVLDTYV